MATYSEESCVAAITSFYEFIERVYLPPGVLLRPPANGWPQITRENMPEWNKNDTVISLMCHIPYFKQPPCGDKYCVARGTFPVPYYNEEIRHCVENDNRELAEPDEWELPPHVLCLVKGDHSGNDYMIDTERGVVIWNRVEGWGMGKKPRSKLHKDVDKKGTEGWAAYPTFEIEEFFQMQKQKFISLEFMPHPNGPADVWEVDVGWEDESDVKLRKIMTDAGWPGDGNGGAWDRQAAEQAMEECADDL